MAYHHKHLANTDSLNGCEGRMPFATRPDFE